MLGSVVTMWETSQDWSVQQGIEAKVGASMGVCDQQHGGPDQAQGQDPGAPVRQHAGWAAHAAAVRRGQFVLERRGHAAERAARS